MHKMRKRGVLRFDKPSSSAPRTLLSSEEAQDIDYEICWCIEKLEGMLLKSGNEKRKKQCETSLKLLRKPDVALIRKRQIMRQYFGDYKKSMAVEKENLKNGVKIHFKNIDAPVKSVCVKNYKIINANRESPKSLNGMDSELICNNKKEKKMYGISLSDNSFRFNF